MIEIREDRLRELLEQRKEYIGTSQIPFDGWFADVAFLMSLLLSDYKSIWTIPASAVCIIFWVLFCIYTAILSYKTYKIIKKPYTTKDLYDDIFNSSDIPHAFNLIAIRNTFSSATNKFLLLYDQRWKCYLLPYCKSGRDDIENIKRVKQFVSNKMGIKVNPTSIKKIGQKKDTKYSYSDKVYKDYTHTFYEVDISPYIKESTEKIKKRSFVLDGYRFKWFTIQEMLKNKRILEKNKETVKHLQEFYE